MLQGPENSPMLSGYSDSPAPPNSIPESCLDDSPADLFITAPFEEVSLKGPRPGDGGFLEFLSEAFSPDSSTCLTTLQEFLNDPNLLDGVNSPM